MLQCLKTLAADLEIMKYLILPQTEFDHLPQNGDFLGYKKHATFVISYDLVKVQSLKKNLWNGSRDNEAHNSAQNGHNLSICTPICGFFGRWQTCHLCSLIIPRYAAEFEVDSEIST